MLKSLIKDYSLRVIDVGARGENILSILDLVNDQVELTGFEPDPVACAELNNRQTNFRSFNVYPFAIGRLEDNRNFYITRLGDLSSLYKPSEQTRSREPFQIEKIIKVSTIPLDLLFDKGVLNGRYDLLKLDTQGSELEILQSGAERLLKDVLCIVCEAEFFEMYDGQPRFSDLEKFLRAQGFELLSVNQHSAWSPRFGFDHSRRKITWADTVFVKSDTYFDGLSNDVLNERIRKMVFFLTSYGYYGEAMRIAEKFSRELASVISKSYKELNANSFIWKVKLVIKVAGCILDPTRKNRVAVARKVMEVRGRDQIFYLTDIGKI